VLSKTVYASGAPWGSSATINYSYDTFGRAVSIQYPFNNGSTYPQTTFTTTYDTMGRPSGLTDNTGTTWVNGAVYDYAGRLQTLTFLSENLETRSYNTVGQIASIGWSAAPGYPYPGGPTGTLSYTFSATQNNGQITQATDGLTGETTVYQYDSLKRLTSASNSAWNETFSYDGFSNLTGKTLNGMLQSIPVDPSTNRVSGVGYDYNGNMTNGAGATMTYNEDNRMSSAQEPSGLVEYYYYTPDGKRFCRQMAYGDTQYTLYGVHGEELGTYSVNGYDTEMSVYFGGRRIWQAPYLQWISGVAPGGVFADRLGSKRNVTGTPGNWSYYLANYYPYGDVPTVGGGQDQLGFATYTQGSYTGLDYANQRMYASTYGRFNTPDPFGGSAKLGNPGSWNRYAYALGDPVNGNDPSGLDYCDSSGFCYSTEECQEAFGASAACELYTDNGDGVYYTSDGVSGYVDTNATGNGFEGTETVSFDTDDGGQTSVTYGFDGELSSDPGSTLSASFTSEFSSSGETEYTLNLWLPFNGLPSNAAQQFVCKDSPARRILSSMRFGALKGAQRGAVTGFAGGEVFEGLGGVPGAVLGGFLGGVLGAGGGVFSGAGGAMVCSYAGVYDQGAAAAPLGSPPAQAPPPSPALPKRPSSVYPLPKKLPPSHP
jgi:RHS repeat-associated protein